MPKKGRTAIPYPIPPEKKPSCQHAENHANMIRKEQCSFAWDWGPSFPTQGIWWVVKCMNAFNCVHGWSTVLF